jgi:hypothetical protein
MPKLKVYLAGPISNCNQKQRNEWRKELKKELEKLGYDSIDPARFTTETADDWTPLREMLDIDRSHVVIANLWRESIGTVVGILQARRRGKPVIVIDQNYLDSLALKKIVGESYIVRSIEKAVHKLRDDIGPNLQEKVEIRKSDGSCELFRLAKLHNFLNRLCADAEIEDALLPQLIAQGVQTDVRNAAGGGAVGSEQVGQFLRERLQELSRDQMFGDDLKQRARRLTEALERHQRSKNDQRLLEALALEEATRSERIARLESENDSLRRALNDRDEQLRVALESDSFKTVLGALQAAKARFESELLVHEKALQSAKASPYEHPHKVYLVLSLLAQYSKERQVNGGRLPLKAWLEERGCPLVYASGESEPTMNDPEARKQRVLNHKGSTLVLEKHLKLGSGWDPKFCCRIYFEMPDSDHGKILVGLVGRHPKTARG